MPARPRAFADMPEHLGIEMASRLTGVPGPTLRYHFDKKRFMGAWRTPSGHRRISRDALLAYLQARGIKPAHPDYLERRNARIAWRSDARVSIAFLDPQNPARTLGQGEGCLEDISLSGFRAAELDDWKGALPGPGMEVAFEMQSRQFRGCRGKAVLTWVLCRGEEFQMGLKLVAFARETARKRWQETIRTGIESRRQEAEALFMQKTLADN